MVSRVALRVALRVQLMLRAGGAVGVPVRGRRGVRVGVGSYLVAVGRGKGGGGPAVPAVRAPLLLTLLGLLVLAMGKREEGRQGS